MDQVVSQTTYSKLVAVGENPMKLDSVLLCVEGKGKDVTSYPMDTIFFCLACFLLRFLYLLRMRSRYIAIVRVKLS